MWVAQQFADLKYHHAYIQGNKIKSSNFLMVGFYASLPIVNLILLDQWPTDHLDAGMDSPAMGLLNSEEKILVSLHYSIAGYVNISHLTETLQNVISDGATH